MFFTSGIDKKVWYGHMVGYYTSIKIKDLPWLKFLNIVLVKTEIHQGTQNAIPFIQSSKIGKTKLYCLGKSK